MYRIYYADGSTYSGAPEAAPRRNVIGVATKKPDGKLGLQYGDPRQYYVWHDGGWIGTDLPGLFDYLGVPGEWTVVLQTRSLQRDSDYWNIVQRMQLEGAG